MATALSWNRLAQAAGRRLDLEVIAQASVASDGVSEAGLPLAKIQDLFASFTDVQYLPISKLRELDVQTLPRDGRCNVLVSNHHGRYAQSSAHAEGVDLHLAIWNPFQVLDIHAPAIVTWGYADGALIALKAWLHGEASASGIAPVALTPTEKA